MFLLNLWTTGTPELRRWWRAGRGPVSSGGSTTGFPRMYSRAERKPLVAARSYINRKRYGMKI